MIVFIKKKNSAEKICNDIQLCAWGSKQSRESVGVWRSQSMLQQLAQGVSPPEASVKTIKTAHK